MEIVKNRNMATVWATSAHLMPFPMGLAGLSNVPIHWRNRATVIPKKASPTGTVSADAQVCRSAHRRILRQSLLQQKFSSPQGTARMRSVEHWEHRTRPGLGSWTLLCRATRWGADLAQ